MLGKQLTGPRDAAISTNDVANRVSAGYANNLRTLVAIARAHHSRVIFATFRAFPEKADRLIPELKGVQRERILKRLHWALDHNNAVMRDIGTELDVACIPFDQWNPSDPSCWLDQCHLDARGEIEKAEYFGQFLIDAGLLGGSPSVSAIRTLLGVENNGK